MERITPKEVTSMMEAIAQVYEKPEVEQVDEVAESEELQENPIDYLGDKFKTGADQIKGFLKRFSPAPGQNPNRSFSGRGSGRAAFRDSNIPADSNIKQSGGGQNQGERPKPEAQQPQQPQQRPQSPSSNLKPGNPNVSVSPKTGEETKFERRMPTMAELRAAQAARAKAKAAGASDKEAGYQATKAGVGVAKGTVKDPKIAADANRKAELERIRQRAASQTRAGVRPTVASTADSNSRTAAGIMSNKSASGSGPGGYQLPAGARPLTSDNAAARSLASRLAAIRAAKSSTGGSGGSTIRNPMKDNMQVGSNTYKSGQRMSAADSASVKDAQSQIRANISSNQNKNKRPINNGDPMERMTGKGAASLMETYSKVYEEREPQAIDEGIVGALKKVAKIGAAAAGAAAGGKALEKATSSKEPTRDQKDAADAKKHLDHYGKTGKMMRNEEKTAADPGMKARMGKEAPKKSGYKLPERTPANAKNVEYYKDDVDLFDVIKGHFIEEGLTEEEALTKMLDLTDEERTEILEGIIGQTADNIARTAGTVVGTVQRGAGYLKQKVKNVKGTFDAARERASSNNPDVRSGRMVRTPPRGGSSSVPATKN